MTLLKRLIVAILVVVGAFALIGFVLPRTVQVSRSVKIDAAPEAIFPRLNSLRAGADWSPWLGRDPSVQLTYSGPDEGMGARLDWVSDHPQVGSGSQEITGSVENTRVETALDFGEMGGATAWFDLKPTDGGTEVTWSFKTDMGANPVGRWMGLMMDRWVGTDYETGLANLKTLVEG